MPNPSRSAAWTIEVGRRLAATRKALDLTQEQLGDEIGVSRTALGNWETGARLPDPAAMARLTRRFKIPMDWIYLGDPAGLAHRHASVLLGEQSSERGTSSSERKRRRS